MQPNVALFQHVPVKRVNKTEDSTRYRLSTHEEADKDAVEARFICRFKPSMEETLSVHNFNYDWVTLRKRYFATFTFDGFEYVSIYLFVLLQIVDITHSKIYSLISILHTFLVTT